MTLRERKKLASWRGIRDAALRLFQEQGYEATTIEQIVAAAQVSRATFFNYFASKEAVVFDQDPEARRRWQDVMRARPADEPLWDALSVVLLEFAETLRDRMPLQRRLKAHSPALAQSTQDFGEQFRHDLQDWATGRAEGADADHLIAVLHLNLALAALGTAYQTWRPEESFDDFLDRLRRCLEQAAPRV